MRATGSHRKIKLPRQEEVQSGAQMQSAATSRALSSWVPRLCRQTGILNLRSKAVAFQPHQARPARGAHNSGIEGRRP